MYYLSGLKGFQKERLKKDLLILQIMNVSRKKKHHLSRLIEESLQGLSPIQMIVKMAEDEAIGNMGLNPTQVISFGGGWCNHSAPEELRTSYQTIINAASLFHHSAIATSTCRSPS